MEKIENLSLINFDTLAETFSKAFEDYEVELNRSELQKMLTRRGFVPKLSFGAFDGTKLVSFTLNGVGYQGTVKTAYDTGTGTLKEYRNRGLASKIFNHSLPFLKEAKIKNYLLEVLKNNRKAVSLYKREGFETRREFNYSIQKVEGIFIPPPTGKSLWEINECKFSEIEKLTKFNDFTPSWQNSFESVQRAVKGFRFLGAYKGGKLLGYGIFEPASSDITQISVEKNSRREGAGTELMREILKLNRHPFVKILNTPVESIGTTKFLQSFSIEPTGQQLEMFKTL